MLEKSSNSNVLLLGMMSMPLFILYDIFILDYAVYIPGFISFLSFEIAVLCFGMVLFFLLRRFRKYRQWSYLGISLIAWLFTAFFFIGMLALE